jgi:hypothetical protein
MGMAFSKGDFRTGDLTHRPQNPKPWILHHGAEAPAGRLQFCATVIGYSDRHMIESPVHKFCAQFDSRHNQDLSAPVLCTLRLVAPPYCAP